MRTGIFLIAHKPEQIGCFPSYLPILAGAQEKISNGYLHDSFGANISNQNSTYNEMTAIYWVYRHLDQFPDYTHVGFCHYRRFFCFQHLDRPFVVRKKVNHNWVCIDQRRFDSLWKEFDMVVPCPRRLRSVRRHYENAHNKEDLDALEVIIERMCPQYLDSFREYIDGNEEYLYNMFVLPRELFLAYGDFIFPVLESFAKERANKKERLFVSERLTGAFLYHLQKSGRHAFRCPILLVRRHNIRLAFVETKKNFVEHPENSFFWKTKPIWLFLLPLWLEQWLRNRNQRRSCFGKKECQ